jgi:LPS sulfotransferase NodH
LTTRGRRRNRADEGGDEAAGAAQAGDDRIDPAIDRSCVICATPRSGSWLLADQLLRTGIAGRPEEYFRPDWYKRFLATGDVRFRHMKSHRDWAYASGSATFGPMPEENSADGRVFPRFLSGVRRIATTPNGVLGIKVHWRQLERVLPSLRAHSDDSSASEAQLFASWFPRPHYVFLRRRDKVRQAISFDRALRTGAWWALGGRSRDGTPPLPEADLARIERLRRELLHQEEQWRVFLRQAGGPQLELAYEDLSRNPRAAAVAVLRFLGLPSIRAGRLPRPRLRRQADRQTDCLANRYWVERRSGTFQSPRHDVGSSDGDGTMRTEILVVDNFYRDSASVRDYALRQQFYYPYGTAPDQSGRERPIWMASRFMRAADCPFKSSAELIARLEELTGEEIDLDYWRADFPVDEEGRPSPDHRLFARRGSLWNCCFHCKPDTGEEIGTGIHNHVVDTWNEVGDHGWSGVVYLNAGQEGAPASAGLKLWRNRNPNRNSDWMTSRDDWELVDAIGNVSNRLILYRGNLPHSGSAGWGQGLRSGRLCQTFFFKTLDPVLRKPLDIPL